MKYAIPGFLVFLLFSFLASQAQLTKPTAETAYTITRMGEIYHVQPRAVDKTFSADLYYQMIRALDQDKIYFSAEDIRQLNNWQYTLNDQLLNKKEDFLKLIINIYTRKINQTDSILDQLSKSKFDLNLVETYSVAEDSSFSPNDAQRKIKIYKLTHLRETYNAHVNRKMGCRALFAMPGVNPLLPVMIRTQNSFLPGRKMNSRVNWGINNCNLDLRWEKGKTQRKSRA